MTISQKVRSRLRNALNIGRSAELAQSMDQRLAALDQKLAAIIEGMNNQSQLFNNKFGSLIQAADNQSRLIDRGFKAVVAGLDNQSRLLSNRSVAPSEQRSAQPAAAINRQLRPGMIAEKTYDTSHPDYDVNVVRNFPEKILGDQFSSRNLVFADLKKMAEGDKVTDEAWAPALQSALAEAKMVPHADLVLHRREVIQQYIADLERRYGSRYIAGWVNLDDALFLYWLVRSLKPKTIVQCGVCNGLSSAFMMLALAKNGSDGQLYAIDMPPIFDSKDPAWTISGKVYGMVVPEGKSSGWMVPEAYHRRFHVQNGDAKVLLPKLVERLPAIDMFYHDSDHTYNHMMFEFRQAKRKLVPGGLIVADDISWNASLWDFADEYDAPAYNFKGAVGAVFL
jgi:predicted O-methyltransferase YrrM